MFKELIIKREGYYNNKNYKKIEDIDIKITELIIKKLEKYETSYSQYVENIMRCSCWEASYNDSKEYFIENFNSFLEWKNEECMEYLHFSNYKQYLYNLL